MAVGHLRDDAALIAGFDRWLAARRDAHSHGDASVVALRRPSAGWTNETVMLDITPPPATLVVRMPAMVPSFPRYPIEEQAAVMRALARAGLPVPAVTAVELDSSWITAPFMVMECVAGRALGETPALDRWLLDQPVTVQRLVHERFLESLAAIHRVDTSALAGVPLRRGLAEELAYWHDYLEWAAEGTPTRRLAEALAWCEATAPSDGNGTPDALLWGDARLGNVMVDDECGITALLDWELATIGPPEMDLAWYLALDGLTTFFVRRTVPGFLERDDAIGRYERALGRPVRDLDWHEVFALVRSMAVNECQARLAARAGTPYPGIAGDDNPVLDHVWSRIENVSR